MSGNVLVLLCAALVLGALQAVPAAEPVDSENGEKDVNFLRPGEIVEYRAFSPRRGFFENNLRIYCYAGVNKTVGRVFESIELQLDIETDDYTQYDGATPEEVRKHHEEHLSLFSITLFSQKRSRLSLSPFQPQCIGIETTQTHRVRLQQQVVDPWRVAIMLSGVLLFCAAGQLSQNSVFFYLTGITIGICSSLIVVVWLTSKLIPRRPMMYGVIIGGSTIAIYVLQLLWTNLQVIVLTYRTYVCWYILVTGTISFFLCYRWGPPQNERSKNIIKWLLQLIAVAFMYFSSHFEEAALSAVLATVAVCYFPRALAVRLFSWYRRRFPKKKRLLTREEFEEQGVVETAKALDELRTYVSSPECKQWRVMRKLQDPVRFAAFVEGASHLRDEELLSFERSKFSNRDSEENTSAEESEDATDGEYEVLQRQPIVSPVSRSNYASRMQRQPVYSPSARATPVYSPSPRVTPVYSPRVTTTTTTEDFIHDDYEEEEEDEEQYDEDAGYFHEHLSHHSNSGSSASRRTPSKSLNQAVRNSTYSQEASTSLRRRTPNNIANGRASRMVQAAQRSSVPRK